MTLQLFLPRSHCRREVPDDGCVRDFWCCTVKHGGASETPFLVTCGIVPDVRWASHSINTCCARCRIGHGNRFDGCCVLPKLVVGRRSRMMISSTKSKRSSPRCQPMDTAGFMRSYAVKPVTKAAHGRTSNAFVGCPFERGAANTSTICALILARHRQSASQRVGGSFLIIAQRLEWSIACVRVDTLYSRRCSSAKTTVDVARAAVRKSGPAAP